MRDVAAQRQLPPFVRRIVARLSAAGLLSTTRGMGGGIRLARLAGEISRLDVVRALEGRPALSPCVEAPRSRPLAAAWPAQRAWTEATAVLEAHLASVRFDRLARGARGHVAAHLQLEVAKSRRAPAPEHPAGRPGASAPRVDRRAAAAVPSCLDWSERRVHLAGALGTAFLDRLMALRDARREVDRRTLAVSPRGLGSIEHLELPGRAALGRQGPEGGHGVVVGRLLRERAPLT